MSDVPERVVFRDFPTKPVEKTLVYLGIEVTGPETCVLPIGWTIAKRNNYYSPEPHIFLNESKEEMARVLFDNSLIVSQAGIGHIVNMATENLANVAATHVVDAVYEHAMDRLRCGEASDADTKLAKETMQRKAASAAIAAGLATLPSSPGTKRKSPEPESKKSPPEIVDLVDDEDGEPDAPTEPSDEPETVVCPPGKRQKPNDPNERDDLAMYQEFLMSVYEIGEGFYADPEPCSSCSKDSELKAKFQKAKDAITDCTEFLRQRVKEKGGNPDDPDESDL